MNTQTESLLYYASCVSTENSYLQTNIQCYHQQGHPNAQLPNYKKQANEDDNSQEVLCARNKHAPEGSHLITFVQLPVEV